MSTCIHALPNGAGIWKGLLTAAVCCFLVAGAFAQNTGSVLGTVRDHTGAVISQAKVVATNDLTGIRYEAVTNTLGDYHFPNLPQGAYTFDVSVASFRPLSIERIEVHVGSTVRQDATLSVAGIVSQVEIVASTPLVNSETSEIGTQTYSEQISNLPLNGRSVYSLIFLTAGTESGGDEVKPSVAGARAGFVRYRIDGVDVNGHNTVESWLTPSADAVEEFRFETQMAPASEASSSNIRVALKSGTNQFHGTLFDFLRNNVLDAHPFFEREISAPGYSYQRGQLRYNQFGGTLGGPVVKEKMFFFFSYEGTRNRTAQQTTNMYPTAAMLTGDFTGVNPRSGSAMKKFGNIYDPKSFAPFPGNQIPASRIHSFAQSFNSVILTANCMQCLASGLGFDFVGTSPGYADVDSYIARVDHHFSSRDILSGSLDIRDSRSSSYTYASDITRIRLNNRASLGTISATHIFTPNLLNEFRGGFLRRAGFTREQGDAEGAYMFLNTPFALPSIHPAVIVSGYTYMGNGRLSNALRGVEEGYNVTDNLTWTHGRHQIQGGLELRRSHSTLLNHYNGIFQYVDNLVPLLGFTTNGFADYLLGLPAAGVTAQGAGRVNLLQRSVWGLYLQDDWKVASNLTLNLGLRWEFAQPWHGNNEELGRLGTLDTSVESRALGGRFLLGGSPNYYLSGKGIVQGNGKALIRSAIIDPRWLDFMPRFGFAFRPFNTNRTAVRGGFGMFFTVPDSSVIQNSAASPPYYFVSTYTNVALGKTPLTIDKFFPEPQTGQAGSQGVDPRLRDPRYYQWTLSLQQQVFSRMVVAVEYMGNRGLKLPIAMPINVPDPPTGSVLAALLVTPSLNTSLAQARRPWQGIPIGYTYTQSISSSWYNAMNVRVEGRFGSRLTFSGVYTFSKALDQSSYMNTGTPTTAANLRLSKSYADFDHPHRLVTSWVYALPFGNQILKPSNQVLQKIADGWQFTGIMSMQSGAPYSVVVGQDTSFRGAVLPVYPVMTGKPVTTDIRETGGIYLTQQNLTAPAFGQLGTLARNAFHGPGINNFDLGFLKSIALKERMAIQFRAEMFNAFNHAQFSAASSYSLLRGIAAGSSSPVLQYTDPSQFGRASARASRIIQFALKLTW